VRMAGRERGWMDGRPPPVSLIMMTVYRCMLAVALSCCSIVVVSVWCVDVVVWFCGGVGVEAGQRKVSRVFMVDEAGKRARSEWRGRQRLRCRMR